MAIDRKDIQLAYGIHRSPNIANEGELSECVNLIPENGELKNIQEPLPLGMLPEGYKLVYVHVNTGFVHYISLHEGALYWTNESDLNNTEATPTLLTTLSGEFKSVTVLGNTLCIYTDTSARFAVFKNGAYTLLANKPVFPSISFSTIATQTQNTDLVQARMASAMESIMTDNPSGFYLDDMYAIRDTIFTELNPRFATDTSNNKFHNPFYIRYAFRMYDNTLVCVSPAIKIDIGYPSAAIVRVEDCDSEARPFSMWGKKRPIGGGKPKPSYIGMRVISVAHELYYTINNFNEIKKSLADWDGLVKSIDFFITKDLCYADPDVVSMGIYAPGVTDITESQAQKLSTSEDGSTYTTKTYSSFSDESIFYGEFDDGGDKLHRRHRFSVDLDLQTKYKDDTYPYFCLRMKDVEDTVGSTFYKILSVEIENLKEGKVRIEPEENVLTALGSGERMDAEAEFAQEGEVIPQCNRVYNGRLNAANVKIKPVEYPLEAMLQYTNASGGESKSQIKATYNYEAYVVINEGGESNILAPLTYTSDSNARLGDITGMWFFYPNANAKYLVLKKYSVSEGWIYSVTPLSESELMNGAYGTVVQPSASQKEQALKLLENNDTYLSYPNKLYVSSANNPFTFPLSGVLTVGTGEILGLVPSTKALSQGQFGQFPMYTFTTDGIWSLEVGSSGLYSSAHPVSRDVCNNIASLTQLDNAVVFSTNRGLKMLQGSDIVSLSDAMDGYNVDESRFAGSTAFAPLLAADTELFNTMLQTCRIAYDYTHGLLRIFPSENVEGITKNYACSLTSGEFSQFMWQNPQSIVGKYPQTILQCGTSLYTLDQNVNVTTPHLGIAITRPMSFGDPFTMKMLMQLRMHYFKESFRQHAFRIAVYGSNDNVNYYRIPSLKQVAVKWYRFVFFTRMCDVDSLQGLSLYIDTRADGRMR